MQSSKESTFPQVKATSAATHAQHMVRKGEHDTALAGKAAASHTHASTAITDWASAVHATVDAWLTDSWSIGWSGGVASVNLKDGGHLSEDAGGVFINVASLAAALPAAANDHVAATVLSSDTISFSISGQQITGSVILASGGGLEVAGGLKCNFGTGAGEVAEGNHTHANDHAALTKQNSNSIALTLAGQELTASLKRAAGDANQVQLNESASGVSVPVGTTSSTCAKGDHTHAVATSGSAGFLSAADKVKLDAAVAGAPDCESMFQSVPTLSLNDYIGGRVRFSHAIRVKEYIASAPSAVSPAAAVTPEFAGLNPSTYAVFGDGEQLAEHSPSDLVIPPNQWIRLKAGGAMPAGTEARVVWQRSAHPRWRVNVPGAGVWPFFGTQHIDMTGTLPLGGLSAADLTGLVDPAPAAVYQNVLTSVGAAFFTGSFPGHSVGTIYTVRFHFRTSGGSPGDVVLDLQAVGETTVNATGVDLIALVGNNHGYIHELQVKPDASGIITAKVIPNVGGLTWSGLEIIEN